MRATFESSGNELPTHTYVVELWRAPSATREAAASRGTMAWLWCHLEAISFTVCVIGFSKSMHYGIVKVDTGF